MEYLQSSASFRDLLLRLRGRTGLTQGHLAGRLGVSRRSVQDWEAGVNHPTAQRLQTLITTLLEAGALTSGREAAEARQLWDAVLSESPRMRLPLDDEWLSILLAARGGERAVPEAVTKVIPAMPDTAAPEATAVEPTFRFAPRGAHAEDWGPAPDVRGFVDRTDELATVRSWLQDGRCRLVALLGMGGVGKTALAARIAQDVAPNYQRVYWRSLRDSPPISEWVAGAIHFFSGQQVVPPEGDAARIEVLLRLLREQPSMLLLDNFETVLQPGDPEGGYRESYAGYGTLLQAICNGRHQSCLLLTSRESPSEFALLDESAARILRLVGLQVDGGRALLTGKQLLGSTDEWAGLVERFAGNALALKVVGESIREVFGGELGAFLNEPESPTVFGGIRRVLDEQFERSSTVEQKVLRVLAVEREPVSIAHLLAVLGPRHGRGVVLEAVEALRRRSLVERADAAGAAAITLQSVALEYVTDGLVERIADEIARGRPERIVELPLIQALAKDHVRQTQERLIGTPLVQRLNADVGRLGAEQLLMALLDGWRGRPDEEQGYGPGNVVNLLRLLRGDLRGLDLSRLAIRQAYLAEVDAQDVRLLDARLKETVLAEAFYFPPSIALSADGALLAAGTSTGEVWLWRTADRTPLWAVQGHIGVVFGVSFSADGQLLASAAGDAKVRLWETSSGRSVATLEGQTGAIWSVVLSPDGHRVVTGGADGMVGLWDSDTGRELGMVHAHSGTVRGVAISGDGHLVASTGDDGTVKVWETSTGRLVASLEGHSGTVWGVALSSDGCVVASGGADASVRLWDSGTGRLLGVLQGHSGTVWGVILSADGQQVVSGGADGTVRLWEVSTGRPVATLPGHAGPVRSVALSADGQLVASGSFDATVKLWEARTGRPVATLQGRTGGIFGVALTADGRLVASGGADGVRLWDSTTGRLVATLHGHAGTIYSVAMAADGHTVASCSDDGTVKVWDPRTAQPVATLEGHTSTVWGVALSADGRIVVSSGGDGTVRVWEARTGRPVATLEGHSGTVWSAGVSADGQLVASGGEDGTVRLWDTRTARPLATLEGHSGAVWGVAISADRQLVASSGEDGTVRLWEAVTGHPLAILSDHSGTVYGVAVSADGRLVVSAGADATVRLWSLRQPQHELANVGDVAAPLAILEGHTGTVRCVAVSADGQVAASGGFDGTVKLWDAESGTCVHTLQPERRYERMDITDLTGVTEAQRTALLALGAGELQYASTAMAHSIM